MAQYIKSMLIGPLIRIWGSKKMGSMFGNPTQKEYAFLIELFEAGKLVPIIDKRYTLSEVAEAFRYLEEGHARGKVIITVDHNNKI
jgi:NADPH:quinone reductase-like Zn-dependent oxidoreductase